MTEQEARDTELRKACKFVGRAGCNWPRCHCRDATGFKNGWEAARAWDKSDKSASLDKKLTELWARGLTTKQCANELGLLPNQVTSRAARLQLPRRHHRVLPAIVPVTKPPAKPKVSRVQHKRAPEPIPHLDTAEHVRFERLVRQGAAVKLLARNFGMSEAEAKAKADSIQRRAA